MEHSQRTGMFFVFLAICGYSFLPVIVKQIQALGLASLDIATWRFTFAMPALWLIIFLRRRPPAPLPRGRLLGLGGLMAMAALTAFFGLERLPASTMVVLFYTYPTMVAIMALFLGDRLPLQGWVALVLTLIGIAFTVPDFSAGFSGDNMIGVLLALLNALIVAVYFILNGRVLRGYTGMMRASAWVITGAFLTFFVVALIRRDVAVPDDPALWVYLLLLATGCTVLPIVSITIGIQHLGASRAAILGAFEPVMTVLIAAAILGERMTPSQMVGGVFIVLSIVLLQTPRHLLLPARWAGKPVTGESAQ